VPCCQKYAFSATLHTGKLLIFQHPQTLILRTWENIILAQKYIMKNEASRDIFFSENDLCTKEG